MSLFRRVIFLGFLMWGAFAYAGNEDWLPITTQDLQIKDVPGQPGAAAIQLYYADFKDDEHQGQFVYHRIKVLNDKGMQYADVEIHLLPLQHLVDLKARTIHPDGTIVDFQGQPFEKVGAKFRDYQFLTKTFTFPEVTVGSIIEYKYHIDWHQYIAFYSTYWTLQHNLYTVKQKLELRGTSKFMYGWSGMTRHITDSQYGLSWVYSNMPPGLKPKKNLNLVELEVENMPAFEPESFMPPAENFKPEVRFFYGGHEVESSSAFWKDYGLDWNSQAEHFIGSHQEIKKTALELISGETDPEKKLRKLYARAQQTRNLTFERSRNKEEEKKEELKDNDNSADVLNRGYGNRNDINLMFIALARAAGFEAQVLRVSSREERFFDENLLTASQLGTYIALVKLNGVDAYFDPGTRFCPFGIVRWQNTYTGALQLDKNGGKLVNVPAATADKALFRRVAQGALDAEGNLKAEFTLELRGNAALERRLEAIDNDTAGRKKILEELVKGWLPTGAIVDLKDAQGWEKSDDPLVAQFNIEVPKFAFISGKRLLMPAFLLQGEQRQIFQHSERKFPVYFPYAYEEVDNVVVQVPDGYAVDTIPANQDIKPAYGRFVDSRLFQGNQFVSKRALIVNNILFDTRQYPELKDFFGKVQAADEEQAVLQRSITNAKN